MSQAAKESVESYLPAEELKELQESLVPKDDSIIDLVAEQYPLSRLVQKMESVRLPQLAEAVSTDPRAMAEGLLSRRASVFSNNSDNIILAGWIVDGLPHQLRHERLGGERQVSDTSDIRQIADLHVEVVRRWMEEYQRTTVAVSPPEELAFMDAAICWVGKTSEKFAFSRGDAVKDGLDAVIDGTPIHRFPEMVAKLQEEFPNLEGTLESRPD